MNFPREDRFPIDERLIAENPFINGMVSASRNVRDGREVTVREYLRGQSRAQAELDDRITQSTPKAHKTSWGKQIDELIAGDRQYLEKFLNLGIEEN